LLGVLFGRPTDEITQLNLAPVHDFMAMRAASVTSLVAKVAALVLRAGLSVGLDCFSPALAPLVGQDLGALAAGAEWTKVMSYCHTLGPAGLPFELLGLADWLVERRGLSEPDALAVLSEASGLPLPVTRPALRAHGLSPAALAGELARSRSLIGGALLAGIELVDLAGLVELAEPQILADLQVVDQSPADGLVLSWDLWHIPAERLDWVQRRFGGR
jgi:hypothetical protein